MIEVSTRPKSGKTKTARPVPVAQQAPAQSERDTLALQVAEILRTMFMATVYWDDGGPRVSSNSHFDAVDHLLGLLLAPEHHERNPADPAPGETREHLSLISSELAFAADLMEERELRGMTPAIQAAYGAMARHAAEYADRLFVAYCADSLDDLRHLTTFAGMRPFRDRPQPPPRRVEQQDDAANELNREQLASVLEHVATSANLLDDLLTRVPQIEGVPIEAQSLVSMAQFMIRQIGAAADQATGSWIVGGLNEWNCGSDFAQLGKAGAAKNDLGASLSALQNLLDSAWQSDDPEQKSGDSNRLLATAMSVIEDLQADYSSPVKVECTLYDVAAQVKAALLVPGDTPSAERVALVGQIGVVLSELLDDPLVLKNWGPAPSSAPAFAFEEIDFPEVIPHARARVIEALSVLEMAAEHHADDAVFGLLHLVGWLDRLYEAPSLDRTPWTGSQFSDLLAPTATVVAVLDDINNRVDCELLSAARTILNVAVESLNDADAAARTARSVEKGDQK